MQGNLGKNEYQDSSSNEFRYWAKKAQSPLKNYEEVLLDNLLRADTEKRILEAGTGAGRVSAFLQKNNQKLIIDAFDSSKLLLDVAKKENSKYGINFFYDDITKLKNIPKGIKYDYAIYLGQVISFVDLENQKIALKKLLKYLKKDGILYISLCNHNTSIFIYIRNLITIIIKTLFTFKYDFHLIPRFRVTGTKFTLSRDFSWWHNRKTVIKLFEDSGFNINKLYLRKDLLSGRGINGFFYIEAVPK